MIAIPASIAHVRSSNGARFESTRPTPRARRGPGPLDPAGGDPGR